MDSSANYLGTSAPEHSMNMSRKDLDFIDNHVQRQNNYQDIIANKASGDVKVGPISQKKQADTSHTMKIPTQANFATVNTSSTASPSKAEDNFFSIEGIQNHGA